MIPSEFGAGIAEFVAVAVGHPSAHVEADGEVLMKPFGGQNMLLQWIAVENHRLQIVKEWPESPYKEATLAAIYFTLKGLSQDSRVTDSLSAGVGVSQRRTHAANGINALAA